MSKERGRVFGAGHVAAMARAGAKEIAQVLPAFPSHGVQPVEETGLVGNPSQMEVVDAKGGDRSYQSMLSARAAEASPQKEEVMER
jgi:hypothetical protein